MLTGTHRAHVREVADEVRRTRDQLHPTRRQAADEVQLVAFPPVVQGCGRAPRTGLVVAGAGWNPQPNVPVAGALTQLQHHPIGAGHLAEVGAGATDAGGADEQRRRQLDQRRRGIKEALVLEREFVVAQGDAAAQLVAVGVDAGANRRGEAAKAVAGIAVQHHLSVELLAGAGEDGDRAPARGAGALVEGMAAVAVQLVVAAVGLEGPAEELLAWSGVLGDQQDRADGGGPGEGAVDVGQARRPAGGVAVGAVAAVACGV